MKTITMFETSWCPYCKQARQIMNDLKQENPKYTGIDVNVIDEELHPEIANKYDYYYVPTFFLDTEKLHEGVPNKNVIRDIFDQCLTA
jgi:thioredoxin 1